MGRRVFDWNIAKCFLGGVITQIKGLNRKNIHRNLLKLLIDSLQMGLTAPFPQDSLKPGKIPQINPIKTAKADLPPTFRVPLPHEFLPSGLDSCQHRAIAAKLRRMLNSGKWGGAAWLSFRCR